jgi:hypothetical protein
MIPYGNGSFFINFNTSTAAVPGDLGGGGGGGVAFLNDQGGQFLVNRTIGANGGNGYVYIVLSA